MTSSAAPPTPPSVRLGTVVGFLVVMEFSSGMLQGWYPPLLGEIGETHEIAPAQLNWVTTIYLLATVVFVPVISKLGDKYGHKKLLVVAAAAVALGSVVVAAAPTFETFLLGRALQTPLGAFLPLEFAIVRSRAGAKAGRGIGLLVSSLTAGASIGLLVSGVLGSMLPLSIVLWAPAILMAACVPIVILLVPETAERVAGSIDWVGAALLGAGMGSLLTAVSNANTWGWTSSPTLLLVAAGLTILTLWAVTALRIQAPLVDLRAIRSTRSLAPILMALPFGGQFLSSITSVSLFAQTSPEAAGFGLGMTSLGAGGLLAGSALASMVGASVGDRIATRIGYRNALMIGGALALASWVGMISSHSAAVAVVTWLLVAGFGNGITLAVLPTVVVLRAPRDSVGIASALYNTARGAGGSIAGAAFALIMSILVFTVGTGDQARTISTESAYVAVWALCGVLTVATSIAAVAIGRAEKISSTTPAASPPTGSDESSDLPQPDGAH